MVFLCELFLVQELSSTNYHEAIESHEMYCCNHVSSVEEFNGNSDLWSFWLVHIWKDYIKLLWVTSIASQQRVSWFFYNRRSGKRKLFRRHKKLPSWGRFLSQLRNNFKDMSQALSISGVKHYYWVTVVQWQQLHWVNTNES